MRFNKSLQTKNPVIRLGSVFSIKNQETRNNNQKRLNYTTKAKTNQGVAHE